MLARRRPWRLDRTARSSVRSTSSTSRAERSSPRARSWRRTSWTCRRSWRKARGARARPWTLRRRPGRARAAPPEAVAALEGLDELCSPIRIEIFFYLGWAETYIEELERALATANRGIELSRATGQGHLIVPLMLARSLPLDGSGDWRSRSPSARRRSGLRARPRTRSTCSGYPSGSAPTRTRWPATSSAPSGSVRRARDARAG